MQRARLEELIQAQLDDELSAAERAELARLLLQDADARRLHDDYLRTDRLLREVPAADPPPGMREEILAACAGQVRPAGTGHWRRWAPLQRLVAGAVGGLLVVGLAYMLSDGRAPGSDLQGSVHAGRGTEIPAAAAQEMRASLQAEGIQVNALLRGEDGALRLELRSEARVPVEVAVKFDRATTSYDGSPSDTSLDQASGEVVVQLPAGRQRRELDFAGAASLGLELRAGGQVLAAARLAPGTR